MEEEMHISVRVPYDTDRESTIAIASAYLARADQTNTIGHNPLIEDVSVSGQIVDIKLTVRQRDARPFINELETLSKVEDIKLGANSNV